jgi:hypothetical protein
MDDEHGLTEDEFDKFDWTRWYYEGKHFEARQRAGECSRR